MENESKNKSADESAKQNLAKVSTEVANYLDVSKLQQIELLVDKLEKLIVHRALRP